MMVNFVLIWLLKKVKYKTSDSNDNVHNNTNNDNNNNKTSIVKQ